MLDAIYVPLGMQLTWFGGKCQGLSYRSIRNSVIRCWSMRKDTKKKKRLNPRVSRRLAARRNGAHLGRPRAFDPDTALEAALRVFWKKGYEGTAVSDLTEAMGINRPSIYATFGNKEALFRKALDRYSERMTCYTAEALKEPTARAVAERLMVGTAELLSCPGNPKGCLMVQGALACGDEAAPVRKELISRRATGEAVFLRELIRAGESWRGICLLRLILRIWRGTLWR